MVVHFLECKTSLQGIVGKVQDVNGKYTPIILSAAQGNAILESDEGTTGDCSVLLVVNSCSLLLDPIKWPAAYDLSVSLEELCKHDIDLAVKSYKSPPEALDVPQNSIYPRDNVRVGRKSTLICHSARFFPPPVRITWTRNGVNVTDESSLSQYYPNQDDTYNQFSHLPFIPQEGDVYTCMVEHKSLETPDTKTWEVDVEIPSVGPAVFCGVGLAVGLLGVATGTFFLVKGN
ncbi:H-2 class II histocompatibility antigen, A-K alpha chain-like [Clarias gariepinus]